MILYRFCRTVSDASMLVFEVMLKRFAWKLRSIHLTSKAT